MDLGADQLHHAAAVLQDALVDVESDNWGLPTCLIPTDAGERHRKQNIRRMREKEQKEQKEQPLKAGLWIMTSRRTQPRLS